MPWCRSRRFLVRERTSGTTCTYRSCAGGPIGTTCTCLSPGDSKHRFAGTWIFRLQPKHRFAGRAMDCSPSEPGDAASRHQGTQDASPSMDRTQCALTDTRRGVLATNRRRAWTSVSPPEFSAGLPGGSAPRPRSPASGGAGAPGWASGCGAPGVPRSWSPAPPSHRPGGRVRARRSTTPRPFRAERRSQGS